MRSTIGRDHLELIGRRLSPGCRVLEWGSGASTVWLAERLPLGAELVSIDHRPERHEAVSQAIGGRHDVSLVLAEAGGGVRDAERFDVILIDGEARVACLERAFDLLRDDGTVFLHDAERQEFDEGKSRFVEHGTLGSCPECPGPLLWWGGRGIERAKRSKASVPVIVSFYTVNTPYEDEVDNLRQSCIELELDHHVEGVQSTGSWERNCAMKPSFIREVADRLDRPVLWLDADAVVRRTPLLLSGGEMDFAIQKPLRWVFASGTVYFNRTPLAKTLLDTWIGLCDTQPDVWDQIHLDTAWEIVAARHPLRTQWLPQTYTKIFDMEAESRLAGALPVIEHFQASRRFKREVSTAVESKPQQMAPQDLIEARTACRPRRCWYDERYRLVSKDPAPALWVAPEPAGIG